MNIVIVQSVRYALIGYDRAIDHDRHRVIYIGSARQHGQIPPGLACEKIERDESRPLFDEVGDILERLGAPVDRLIAIVEEELLDAARLRERFGIPGPTLAQAEKVRNKAVMKRCVAEAGLRVPRFARLGEWLSGRHLPIEQNAAVILKPLDGASSIDVRRFESQGLLAQAIATRCTGIARLDGAEQQAGGFEVEEFVSGSILHVDGIARRGRIEAMVQSRHVGTCLAYAGGEPFGCCQQDLAPGMAAWVARVLAAVEIRDGAFHLEAIDTRHGPVFLEIAHRVGGGRINEVFERKTGLHLGAADVGIVVDPDYPLAPHWDHDAYYAWFIVPGHHLSGPYCRVTGHEWLRDSGAVEALDLLAPDQRLCKELSYAESVLPLAGLLRMDSPQRLEATLRQLFAGLHLEDRRVPDDGAMALAP
ncbi:ATP-grasp domain-containing protein [Pelomonas sp. CA6]|uniref:ATP-grasp domain-containing protein n=1 Tax=Pelomonas sp. CA6 TaxID=2907999 RepID=UPI001F4BE644|nr:ATP-grasp domain-containing protein [Pelomonas sp. CA6]MCH7344813.1 ATP-grasp domain-containing protein [Pelomonas sp. CA6]